MAAAQPKKMLIMHILDILKKYTDEDHRLSQKEIGEILKNEYDMVVDRKSIKRNLMDLPGRCGRSVQGQGAPGGRPCSGRPG